MTITLSPPLVEDESVLDEHADELCFALAMALRRILAIEALDAEEEPEGDQDADIDD